MTFICLNQSRGRYDPGKDREKKMKRSVLLAGLGLLAGVVLTTGAMAATPAYIGKAVSDPARPPPTPPPNRGPNPAELTEFAGIKPGMKVVDLLPGAGYFT